MLLFCLIHTLVGALYTIYKVTNCLVTGYSLFSLQDTLQVRPGIDLAATMNGLDCEIFTEALTMLLNHGKFI